MLLSSLTAAALQSARRSNAAAAAAAAAGGGAPSGATVMRSNSIPASAADIQAVLRPKSTPPVNLSLMDATIDAVLDASFDLTPSESSSSIDSQNGLLGLVGGSGGGGGGGVLDPGGSRSRQQVLEDRHQELLRKQRLLQDQYTKLQMLSRGHIPEDLLHDLKKTGSESNLVSKSAPGANLTHGSLSQLLPNFKNQRPFATLGRVPASHGDGGDGGSSSSNGKNSNHGSVDAPVTSNGFQKNNSQLASSSPSHSAANKRIHNTSPTAGSHKTHVETQKIYETDIL